MARSHLPKRIFPATDGMLLASAAQPVKPLQGGGVVTSPFLIRGAAEAHVGTPWSWAARERFIRYLGDLGFTHYIYAPAGDPLVQSRWWEPYLPDEVDSLVDMTQVGARRGVTLCYALRLGSGANLTAVAAKLRPLYYGGIRAFAIFGTPDALLCELLVQALPGIRLLTDVQSDSPAIMTIGEEMPKAGDQRPPVLWTACPRNSAANSLNLRPARAPDLADAVQGIIVESPPQPEAARVTLHTWAAYLRNPETYDPDRAWVQALSHVAPEQAPALRLLGELTRSDCAPALPDGPDPVDEARARLEEWSRAAEALKALTDKALRDDLRPWVAKLAASADAGLRAIQWRHAAGPQAERLRGQVLAALWRLRDNPAWVAGDQAERFVRECLHRPISG